MRKNDKFDMICYKYEITISEMDINLYKEKYRLYKLFALLMHLRGILTGFKPEKFYKPTSTGTKIRFVSADYDESLNIINKKINEFNYEFKTNLKPILRN
jgi:hypothetical protein